MKRRTDPDFYARMIVLDNCQTCKGKAVIKGVFYELACLSCNGSGWVHGETGEALTLEQLATQLGLRYRQLLNENKHLRWEVDASKGTAEIQAPESRHYEQNNRRGAGGTNYTGD